MTMVKREILVAGVRAWVQASFPDAGPTEVEQLTDTWLDQHGTTGLLAAITAAVEADRREPVTAGPV